MERQALLTTQSRRDSELKRSGGSVDELRAGPDEAGIEVSDSSSCRSSTFSSLEEMLRTSVDMPCVFELSVCRQLDICLGAQTFETVPRSRIPFLQTESVREGKELSKKLFHKCSAAQARKRPTMPEQAHGFVVLTCDIARGSARDNTHFSIQFSNLNSLQSIICQV